VVLGKQADPQPVVDATVSVEQLQFLRQGIDQSGLSGTVRTDERYPRVQVYVDVDLRENRLALSVPDRRLVQPTERRRELLGVREHEDTGGVLDDLCYHVYPLDRLDPRLDKRGPLCVVAELVDELLDVGDLVQLTLSRFRRVFVLVPLGFLELREVSSVVM